MLSRALKQACPVLQNSIRFSSKIIKEIHPENDEIAILKMNSPPVNPLSRPFLKDLHNAILECEQDEDIRGLILTSNKTGVFSAGLDITEMWRKPEDEVRAFWIQLQDTWRALYSTPLATCAAINGASPAGGCLLSISCDHRIMINHPKFTIGLNETKLGLVAPIWFAKCFQDLLGKRKAERYLYLGSLLPVDQALNDGLIDETCAPTDDITALAVERLEEYLMVPDFARAGTKQVVTRGDNLAWFDQNREKDLEIFIQTITDEKVQSALDMYMAMLQAKSKK